MFNNIRKERTERNLSLQDAAEGMGISLQQLQEWESGESEPYASDIRRLSEFYQCSPDYLLGLAARR